MDYHKTKCVYTKFYGMFSIFLTKYMQGGEYVVMGVIDKL